MRRLIFRAGLALVLLLGVGLGLLSLLKSPVIFGLREDMKRAIPHQTVPSGVGGLSAEECGACHREIYEEWKTSIHSQAFTDPFFQSYWRKDRHIWVCLNCHAPLQNQQPTVVTGLRNGRINRPEEHVNPNYDESLQHEGITCAVCHVRDGVMMGPFDDAVAPHPTKYDPRYRSTDICYTCHAVPSDRFQFYNGGPCATFMEYEAGPYKAKGYICQDCHMPEVERVMADGGPVRKGRRHLWRGGHDPEQLKRAFTAALTADQPRLQGGHRTRWTLSMTNSGAGHMLPTGDPDRYFLTEIEVRDRTGRVVASRSHTIRRWIVWWPVIYEYRDTRIPPLASRELTLDYAVPEADEGLTITARVSYRFMTDRQYQRLKTNYGLDVDKTYAFTLYEQTVPLRAGEAVPQVAQAAVTPSCMTSDHSAG